ncbi:hypothetical protein Y027_5385 [Burkholderia pseudomallei TSV5]|nr:hypothetical protein Y027_5385 [Burkholderia pseudomallei TSV5]
MPRRLFSDIKNTFHIMRLHDHAEYSSALLAPSGLMKRVKPMPIRLRGGNDVDIRCASR